MTYENLPPKPSHKPFEQSQQPEKHQIPLAAKLGAGAAALTLLGAGSYFVAKKYTESQNNTIEANPAATASQSPTESAPTTTETSTPTAEPSPSTLPTPDTEPTISTYESLEMTADYESPLDPELLARQYFEMRNKAIMLGCDQNLINEYKTFTGTQDDTAYELVSSKTEERRETIGEQMGGPEWEGDPATAAWVESRALQNENACYSFLSAAKLGKTYDQTDTIDSSIEVIEEIEMPGGTRIISLDVPVHTQALIDGDARTTSATRSIPTWDYKFTASVSIVVHGEQSGAAAGVSVDGAPGQVTILSEFYDGERYDIIKEPPEIAFADR